MGEATDDSNGAYLRLRHMTKRYGKATGVSDLSLSVSKGEVFALLGPSGCGKSTTLGVIAGFVAPDHGDIDLNGQRVTHVPSHKRDMGVVFQSHALFPHMTVGQNVAFGLRRRRVREPAIATQVSEALDMVGLGEFRDRFPDQMSGGQQQRVALARALVIRPTMLLLDEPLSSLDARLRVDLRRELRSIVQRSAVTTLFVTHDQEEAMFMADRVGVMDKGVLQQVGTPEEVYRKPESFVVANFIGHTNQLVGTLARSTGNRGTVVISDGVSVTGRVLDQATPGDLVKVCMRPESIQVDDPVTGEPGLDATLVSKAFLGERFELIFMTRDDRQLVGYEGRVETNVGTSYRLQWNDDDATIFKVST